MGYSEAAVTILALLCSEPDVVEVELDSQTYYVAQSDRRQLLYNLSSLG
ncbi:MAG: hypothetical protein MGF17_02215 [Trichodesmium sp. MAG_R04]|nr:hypothetical protein [Trichodesmium sp. MAG_R04]